MFRSKTTKLGTELPLLDLKGKPYMQVAHRLVWFREENPNGIIHTEFVKIEADFAIAKATILLYSEATKQYQEVSTGFKKETVEGFPDFVEKAETGAIGRALAIAGYGTQFETGFEEEGRLADAPVIVPQKNETTKKQPKVRASNTNATNAAAPTPVQAAAVNPVSATPTSSSTGGEGSTGVGSLPKTSNRQEVNNLIYSMSSTVVAKRLMTKDEIIKVMQARYGVSKKEELSDGAAQEFLSSLHRVANGIESLAAPTTTQ